MLLLVLSPTHLHVQAQPDVGGERHTNQQAANTGAGKTRSPASLLQPDPLDPLLGPVDRVQRRLNQNDHLALKASYTFLEQNAVSTPGPRHNEVNGRLDFQGVWTVHEHQNGSGRKPDQTTLNLLFRSQTNIGYSRQWDLNDSLGSALGVDSLQGSGPEQPTVINLLYLKQTLDAERIAFCVGKLQPQSAHMAQPGHGVGVGGDWEFSDRTSTRIFSHRLNRIMGAVKLGPNFPEASDCNASETLQSGNPRYVFRLPQKPHARQSGMRDVPGRGFDLPGPCYTRWMATSASLSPEILAKYEPVIGLEVHVQLRTRTKAFCGCENRFGAEPNTLVCPVCLGLPGALPVLNARAVEFATLAAQAIHARVREVSVFARKNYFYPDLPKGYQISQFDKPLAEHGWLEVDTPQRGLRRIGITRLHMEEDAGKSLHDGMVDSAASTSVDLNRCGTPLIEIVSEPDLRTPNEAYEYLTKLKEILLYTGVSDCNMEEGSLRCDANVSVRPRGQEKLGTKAEVKNVNSFRYIRAALEYEIERQIELIESGGRVVQETRLWNAAEGRTYSMRSKEQAHDYRYFPEPDLPVLVVSPARQAEIAASMPELPEARRARMIADYGIAEQDAYTLTGTRDLADRFEQAARAARNPRRVANLVLSELTSRLKLAALELEHSPISMAGIAMAADLAEEGKLSSKQLKQLFDSAFATGEDFPAVYEREKPQQISDTPAIEAMIDEVIAASPKQVEQYRGGKKTVAAFFIGQAMRLSKGQANPALLNELVTRKLDN